MGMCILTEPAAVSFPEYCYYDGSGRSRAFTLCGQPTFNRVVVGYRRCPPPRGRVLCDECWQRMARVFAPDRRFG